MVESLAGSGEDGLTLVPSTEEAFRMAFKPNYNQQRAERNRLKQTKKDAKLREKEDARERRKAEEEASAQSSETPVANQSPDDGTRQ